MDPVIQQTIDAAKKAGHSVFSITVSGREFIYRSINRAEFRELQRQLAEDTQKVKDAPAEKSEMIMAEVRERAEERIVKLATLHPTGSIENELAGVITTLADLIMSASGFGVEAEPKQL